MKWRNAEADIVSELHGLYMENAQFAIQLRLRKPYWKQGLTLLSFIFQRIRGTIEASKQDCLWWGVVAYYISDEVHLHERTNRWNDYLWRSGYRSSADVWLRRLLRRCTTFQNTLKCWVLRIYHKWQYGGYAYSYWKVEEESERTHTILKVMDEEERTEEIARMLSGTTITALTRKCKRIITNFKRN